jgi:predicted DNA-binding antitoxin AbrB/MazE fold protein
MGRMIDAIYENGTLKPLDVLDLPEHQRVRMTPRAHCRKP